MAGRGSIEAVMPAVIDVRKVRRFNLRLLESKFIVEAKLSIELRP